MIYYLLEQTSYMLKHTKIYSFCVYFILVYSTAAFWTIEDQGCIFLFLYAQ